MSKRSIKLAAYFILTTILIIGLTSIIKSNNINQLSPTDIKDVINKFGILGPVIFIIMFTLVPLTLFPDAILAIAAGLTFGLTKGALYTILGAMSGATLSFYLSRCLGKDFIKTLIKRDISIPGFESAKNNFLMILLLRLIPLFPFDIISYGAGLSKINYKVFIAATFIGIIPGVAIYVNLGDKSSQPFSLEFMASLLLLLFIIIASFYLKKSFSARLKKVFK